MCGEIVEVECAVDECDVFICWFESSNVMCTGCCNLVLICADQDFEWMICEMVEVVGLNFEYVDLIWLMYLLFVFVCCVFVVGREVDVVVWVWWVIEIVDVF